MILKYICVLQIDNANVFICIFTILKTLGFFESFQLKKKQYMLFILTNVKRYVWPFLSSGYVFCKRSCRSVFESQDIFSLWSKYKNNCICYSVNYRLEKLSVLKIIYLKIISADFNIYRCFFQ